jgi:uncharacterized protein
MDIPTADLQLNVGFIAQQSIGYSRSFQFDIPALEPSPEILFEAVRGEIVFARTSEGLLSQGKFQGQTAATCGRCMEPFPQILQADFTELFSFPGHEQEETDLVLPDDGHIDFGPIVGEYMAIEIPITPICREDCQGLCVECGNNLNETECSHEEKDIDPRLAVLKSLLDEDEAP